MVGSAEGSKLGRAVGIWLCEGWVVGSLLGVDDGTEVGPSLGCKVGTVVG